MGVGGLTPPTVEKGLNVVNIANKFCKPENKSTLHKTLT